MNTTFNTSKQIISKAVFAVVACALIFLGTTSKAAAQGQPDVQLSMSGNQYWVTCVTPASGRAMLVVRVQISYVAGDTYHGTWPATKVVELPLRNMQGAQTEAATAWGLSGGQIISVKVLR